MYAQFPLYLASSSSSRKYLLSISDIPFTIIEQTADETLCDWTLPLEEVVRSIAMYKMAHAVLPTGTEGQIIFVLTADTLSKDPQGQTQGKPVDKEDALVKLEQASLGLNICCTAFCLEKKQFINGSWKTIAHTVRHVTSSYYFNVPPEWRQIYLEKSPSLQASGAIAIEDFGTQFLQTITSSYSTIVGLPLFELRQSLENLGFFTCS